MWLTHTRVPAVCGVQVIISLHSALKHNGTKGVFGISEGFNSGSLAVSAEFGLLVCGNA